MDTRRGLPTHPQLSPGVSYDWCCRERNSVQEVAGNAFVISAGSAIIDGKM